MNNRKKLLKDQRILLAFVIVAIIAVVSMINPKFIAVKNLITIFQQISVIGILTMAMSMLLISGGIDLSVGNIMVLSGDRSSTQAGISLWLLRPGSGQRSPAECSTGL